MNNICTSIPYKTISIDIEYFRKGGSHNHRRLVRAVDIKDAISHCNDKIATSNERTQINGEFWSRLKNDLQHIL